jgi:alpha-L-fucosidase 2
MDAVPRGVPSRAGLDAPLLGNGGLGAVLTGKPDAWPLQFWIMKSNFCKLRNDHRKGGPRPFGVLNLHMPALVGGTWRSEQNLFPAITKCIFTKDGLAVTVRTYIAATEDILIVELVAEGGSVDVETKVFGTPGRGSTQNTGEKDGMLWANKMFHTTKPLGGTHVAKIETKAGVAVNVVGQDNMTIKLKPGKPVTIALAMQSNFDAEAPLAAAQKLVATLTSEGVKQLEKAHRQWWCEFWAKSLIEIEEPDVQQAYYAANYQQGSGMRDKIFPPGLFGLWVTHDDPCWAGDYHLNFDYQSQFYSLYKNNHIEQADVFEQPILDFMPRGKWYAEKARGMRGVYYPVGIWAKGFETSRQPGIRNNAHVEFGGVFLGQRGNAAYCLVPMAMRWYHTYDLDYAKKIYPFAIEVANFWEDYLKFEDGRYIIYGDSAHESIHTGGQGDVNGPLGLGLVRNAFTLILDMSKELGIDADRREKWEHILTNLSKFATFEKDGKTVFRYSETGTEWVVDNSVGVQHIYPAGAVGLDDLKLAQIGRNMVKVKNRWNCDNGTNSMYPAAVRVGYDALTLLKNLRNLFFANSARTDSHLPRSLEEGSTVPNTINEMLCMSHRQVLRLFPVWPKDKDAQFWTLRAEGAFLVSSQLKDGTVQFVKILSEKGRDCTIVNPWPGKKIVVYSNGKKIDTLKGDRVVLKTTAGETVVLGPKGKGYPVIAAK